MRPPLTGRSHYYDLNELEFGDYGRDPRFLPGWWVIPLSSITLLSIWLCVIA